MPRKEFLEAYNRFAGFPTPTMPEPEDRHFEPSKAAALLDWIDAAVKDAPGVTGQMHRNTALLFRLIYVTGCRPEEVCIAQWTGFDPARACITLRKDRKTRRVRHKTGQQTQRNRRISITREVVVAIEETRSRPGRHEVYIFTHRRGKNAASRGATEPAAGEPWKPNALAHRFRELRDEAAGSTRRSGTGRVNSRAGTLA